MIFEQLTTNHYIEEVSHCHGIRTKTSSQVFPFSWLQLQLHLYWFPHGEIPYQVCSRDMKTDWFKSSGCSLNVKLEFVPVIRHFNHCVIIRKIILILSAFPNVDVFRYVLAAFPYLQIIWIYCKQIYWRSCWGRWSQYILVYSVSSVK